MSRLDRLICVLFQGGRVFSRHAVGAAAVFLLAVPGLPLMHSTGCWWGVSLCVSPRQPQSQRGCYRDQEQRSLQVGAKPHRATRSLPAGGMGERIGKVTVQKLMDLDKDSLMGNAKAAHAEAKQKN